MKYNPSAREASELNYILGHLEFREHNFDEALPYARNALSFAREGEDYYTVCKCSIFLGQVSAKLNRYRDARKAWKEGLEVAKRHKNLRVQGMIHFNVSILEHKRGKYEYALKLLKLTEYCSEMVGDFNMQARCYGRMVSAYLELDEMDKAQESAKKMNRLASRMDIPKLQANTCHQNGFIHMKQERYGKAAAAFEEAASIYEKLGDVGNQITSIRNIASAHMESNDFDKSESLLRKASRLARNVESDSIQCDIKLSYAELKASTDDRRKTMTYFLEALTLAEKIENEDRFVGFHKKLKVILEKKLDFNLQGLEVLLKRARRTYKTMGLLALDREARQWLERIKTKT